MDQPMRTRRLEDRPAPKSRAQSLALVVEGPARGASFPLGPEAGQRSLLGPIPGHSMKTRFDRLPFGAGCRGFCVVP